MSRITIKDIQAKKRRGEKITVLTAYDYSVASLLDKAQIDVILVGDSLANVALGLESTRDVGMEEMLHHTKAVNRAVQQALLVGDMPYSSYQVDPQQAVLNAQRFINEGGCGAVKLEWFENCLTVVRQIVKAGIPVMGHVGLTPQTAQEFKVQGKDAQSAQRIIDAASALEKEGCFGIVLECVPAELAAMITKNLTIPTIGIGAGIHCDGQVLVTNDLLGLFDRYKPKFVKQYANLGSIILEAVKHFCDEVKSGDFPDENHCFSMNYEELAKIKNKK